MIVKFAQKIKDFFIIRKLSSSLFLSFFFNYFNLENIYVSAYLVVIKMFICFLFHIFCIAFSHFSVMILLVELFIHN